MTDDIHFPDETENQSADHQQAVEACQQAESTIQITQWGECDVYISYSETEGLLFEFPYPHSFGPLQSRTISQNDYDRVPSEESVALQRQQLHANLESLPEACGAIAYRTIALSNLSQFRADHERAYRHGRDSSPELEAGLDALQDFIDVLATVERAVADVQSSGNHSRNPSQKVVESVEQAFDLQPTGILDRLRNVAKRRTSEHA